MNIVGLPALVGTYDNYIWVIHNEKQAWVVDPGESLQVLDYLKQQQLTLQGILVTHRHFDHIDGIDAILEQNTSTPVYGPKNCPIPSITQHCAEGDVIHLNDDLVFKVLETPGHTEDHIAFYNEQYLFCGDTLFTAGCGRILGGTAAQFSDSILKLRNLSDDTQFFCAHEYTNTNLEFALLVEPENKALQQRIQETDIVYPSVFQGAQSSLKTEKSTNPFMRFDQAELKAKLLKRGAEDSAESLFKTLRTWKDEFDRSH